MKKISLAIIVLLTAYMMQAQPTKQIASPRTLPVQMVNKNINLTRFTPVVTATRQQTYAGTFNPAPIVRNVGGVTISSTASINSTNGDYIATKPDPGKSQTSIENGFECTTSHETVTADSKSFMSVTANGDGIYPGALYTYSDFMNGNFLKEVGVGKRNPIQVFTNNLANSTGDVAVTVANPNSVNIYSAIANLVRNNSVSNVSATQIGQYIYSQNQASLVLSISGGGAYSGFSASAGFNLNKQANHIYVTCDFKIPLYSLYTNFPENGFLSDPNLEKTPNLVLVNSVTYGTRVLVNIDIDESSLDLGSSAKFKYGDPTKAGFNVDLNFLMTNKNIKNTVNTYVVGARPQNLGNPTTVEQVFSFVDACIRNTNYQTAKPISYTLSTMAGELVGIRSATDDYIVKNCVPKASTIYLANASISISTKGNYKENGSNAAFYLYGNNGAKLLASAPNNNGQMGPNSDYSVGLTVADGILQTDIKNGKNYLEIVLDRPNCVFTCDDWEIDQVFITLNYKDETGTILSQLRKTFSICSSAFVIQKGKKLRLEFSGDYTPLSQYITQ